MGERYVAAIDQGTTGTRVMVFDHDARVLANVYGSHDQHYPQPGWVEHDPIEIWETVRELLREAVSSAGIDPGALAAIGITNQRETTVLWDADTGTPVHNAIVWQDRRTTDRVEALLDDGKDDWIRAKTGLEPDAYFSATKLEWLLDHVGRDRVDRGDLRFGTIDSWLLDRLTGEHVTDVTNAARTMLFDIHDLDWDDELLAEFDVPRSVLPTVRPSIGPDAFGSTAEGVLGESVPVVGVLGDQQAALFGQTCFEQGEAKNTYGTGSFFLTNTGTAPVPSEHGLLTTIAFQRAGEGPRYALEGSIFATGAAIEWLEDLGLIDDPAATERLARAVDSTDDVYVVPAFSGLGAPHWDGRARGTIVGLTRGTRREHVVRATLESIAYQTRDVVEAVEADTDTPVDELKVDGGAVANDLLCQLQADLIGLDVRRPVVDETTALGAAFAAGLGVEYWDSLAALRETWREDRRFTPELDPAAAARKHDRWQDALDRSRGWAQD